MAGSADTAAEAAGEAAARMPDVGRGAVVITGASTGIGHACALRLAARGYLVLAGVRRQADAERLRSEPGGRLEPVTIDVAEGDSIAAAAGRVDALTGERGLAGLVNNAGVATPGPLEYLPLDALRRQLEVNLVGQIAVTQAFLPLLRRGGGRVVNMGSVGGRAVTPFLGAYSMSKFALEAATDALRQELRPWGIDVAIVEPGAIATPIWEKGGRAGMELAEAIPAEGRELYGPAIASISRASRDMARSGIDADEVAKVVEKALGEQRPRARYLVGRDAWARVVLSRLLPERAVDALVARRLGLPRRGGAARAATRPGTLPGSDPE